MQKHANQDTVDEKIQNFIASKSRKRLSDTIADWLLHQTVQGSPVKGVKYELLDWRR